MPHLFKCLSILCILVFLNSHEAQANGGPVDWNPESIQGDLRVIPETQISLRSEILNIKVKDATYSVEAQYTLSNPGPQKDITFGIPLSFKFGEMEPTPKVSITINGKKQGCKQITQPKQNHLFEKPNRGEVEPSDREEGQIRWCVTRITVPKGNAIPLTLAYDSVLQFDDWATNKHWRVTYSERILSYMLSPAGYWAGVPQHVAIYLDLGPHADTAVIKGPAGFKRVGNKVTWSLNKQDLQQIENLEVAYNLDMKGIENNKQSLKLVKDGTFPWRQRNPDNLKTYSIRKHTQLRASSTLKGKSTKTYHVNNLIDGDLSTAWCEGAKGPGFGETIELRLKNFSQLCFRDRATFPTLVVIPGYAKNKKVWEANNRVTKAIVRRCNSKTDYYGHMWKDKSFDAPGVLLALIEPDDFSNDAPPFKKTAKDMFEGNDLCIRFEIDDVAKGNSQKDNDTCISELLLTARCWMD
jgi:hypothetical protein